MRPRNICRSSSNPAADEKWPLDNPQVERPWPFQFPTGAEIYVKRSPAWTCLATSESYPPSRVEAASPRGHFWWTEVERLFYSLTSPSAHSMSAVGPHRRAAGFSQNTPAHLDLPWASPAHCLPSPEDTSVLLMSSTCNFTSHSHMVFIFLSTMFAKVVCEVLLCTI